MLACDAAGVWAFLCAADLHRFCGMDGNDMLKLLLPASSAKEREQLLEIQGRRYREDFLPLVVGDTPYDAEAARHLHVWPVGVMSGHFPASALRAAGCREVFRDPVALCRMLSPPAETGGIAAQAS
jgi:hypothetical protein